MRSVMKALAVTTVAAFAFSVPVAQAREDMDADKFVKQCDADKDGMVSRAEMMKMVEKTFEKADGKKMGKLDKKQVEFFLNELMKSGGG